MASPQAEALINYIKAQLAQGYTQDQLRLYLQQYGYAQELIDEAFASMQKPKFSLQSIHISPLVLAISAGVIVLVGVIVLIVAFLGGGPSIELTTQSAQSSVEAGESFSFSLVSSAELPSSGVVQVNVLTASGSIAAQKTVQARQGAAAIPVEIDIPEEVQGGSYVVRSTLSLDGESYGSDLYIAIQASQTSPPISPPDEEPPLREGTCFDGIQNGREGGIDCGGDCEPCQQCPASCDDGNACTEETCSFQTNFECVISPIFPCCGNKRCEENEPTSCPGDCPNFVPEVDLESLPPEEVIEQIQTTDIDPNEAGALCNALPEQLDVDECFDALAQKTENPNFCLFISEPARDNCYMEHFVLTGKADSEMCESIRNQYLKTNCQSLQQLTQATGQDFSSFDPESFSEEQANGTTTEVGQNETQPAQT